ncbi:MAG: TolC family protein [Bacteroidota bacterium]|nr:TolC family protein [Bacteroidota bacterium]
MKKRTRTISALFFLLAFCGGFSSVAQNKAEVLNIDLKTALTMAEDRNPTIKIADLEIQRVDYSKKETWGNLLPNISATGQYTNNIMKSVMFMPASMSAAFGGKSYMEIGYKNSFTGTLSASMPLVNFALWEQLKSKQTEIDLILEQARASKIDMRKQVTDAYFSILLAEASLKVLQQSIDNAKETLKTTKASYEQGVSSEYDYIRAQVQVNNLNPSYLSAKNGVDLAKLQLKMLLSIPMEQEVEVSEVLTDYEANLKLLEKYESDRLIEYNSTLRQLDLNIQSLQHSLRMTKYQHLPTLSAFGQYAYQTQAEDFKFGDYKWVGSAAIGLTLNIPIFSGNTIINQTKQVQLSLKELQLQRDYTSESQNLQVTSALDNMRTANEQLLVNKEAIAQAEKGYEIAKVRYNTGSGTILELNDSELALTQSRLNYQQALYDYLSAEATLEQVLGRYATTD